MLGKIPSTTAVIVGNFIVSKSILSPYLKRLGYKRNKKVTGIGRLYFKVNNFAEIILAIYYLHILSPKNLKKIARDPMSWVDGIVRDRIAISSAMTCYLEFRNELYRRRCISLGVSDYDRSASLRDTVWLNTLSADSNATQIIMSGEELGIPPSIICIALLEHNLQQDINFILYRDRNLARVQKDFVSHHYIRSALSRIPDRYKEMEEVFGFTHADVNAMATEYQDHIQLILERTRNGEFLNI